MSARIILKIPGSPAPDARDGDCRDAAPAPRAFEVVRRKVSADLASSDPGGVLRGAPALFQDGKWKKFRIGANSSTVTTAAATKKKPPDETSDGKYRAADMGIASSLRVAAKKGHDVERLAN